MRQLASRLMGAAEPCATAAWRSAVAAHLERVLNTRPSAACSAPTYGLPGGAEGVRALLEQLPTSAPVLEQQVMQALTAHDRRIVAWRTRRATQWGTSGVTLQLAGDLAGAPSRVEVCVVVELMPSGHAQVRPA